MRRKKQRELWFSTLATYKSLFVCLFVFFAGDQGVDTTSIDSDLKVGIGQYLGMRIFTITSVGDFNVRSG